MRISPMPHYGGRPIAPLGDSAQHENMQNETAIEVDAADKLHWLRRLDGAREWKFLDDRRCCRCCGKTFSGRQAQLIGGTRPHGPLRFVCPTPNCESTPADWLYAHESGAVEKESAFGFRRPRVVRVKHSRHVLARYHPPVRRPWKLRHAFHFLHHFGLAV